MSPDRSDGHASASGHGRLTVEELRQRVATGDIHTVILGFPDMQGRLQGKRCSAAYFLDDVLDHGSGACNYLLSVNVEMEPQSGFAISSWGQGLGDFMLFPDPTSLRVLGWLSGVAVCFADVHWPDGRPVAPSPRQILRRQLERLAERGWIANAATELEFIVHRDSFAEAWDKGYNDLQPVSRYNIDYSLFGVTQADPLIERICRGLESSGIVVETAKGEANLGQHEINLRYDEALDTADKHVLFKHAVREIALQSGVSATFMAKLNAREGNSCHVHISLADARGDSLFAGQRDLFDQFIAGQLACMRELTLMFAPNINSYKRFTDRSFAPTAIAWGYDNRTCAVRVLGERAATRLENRLGGADVNPYLVLAAIIAAGLHGIDNRLALPPAEESDAYIAGHERVPLTLADATESFTASTMARAAFGDLVVDHYTRAAQIEIADFNAFVTDWEKKRGYERL
ncbi:glutamine synthetase family protein (plasmid) [Mycobacterium sp. TJFP1]